LIATSSELKSAVLKGKVTDSVTNEVLVGSTIYINIAEDCFYLEGGKIIIMNNTFNTSWNFYVQTGSPSLTKGTTSIERNFAVGFTVNGVNYTSPAPSTTIGAFGIN